MTSEQKRKGEINMKSKQKNQRPEGVTKNEWKETPGMTSEQKRKGGSRRKKINNKKSVRKHKGIIKTGKNKGQLKKGYKYTGKKLKSGLPQIIKV